MEVFFCRSYKSKYIVLSLLLTLKLITNNNKLQLKTDSNINKKTAKTNSKNKQTATTNRQ